MLLFFNQSINPKLVQALGWTLVHSLWQGIIIAILAGIVILLTKKTAAAIRYNLLVILLFAFAAGITGTFIYEWNQGSPAPQNITSPAVSQPVTSEPSSVTLQQHPAPDSFTLFRNYFSDNMPAIVLIWALVFLFQFTRLLAGLHHIHTLRRRKILEVPASWKEKLLELSWAMGIGKAVTLFESALVQVPITVGHLKPVILLPAGLLTNLSVQQIESILIHELAHIRRKDYAVNLLQSFMETVFFFNPALWWLSSLIREEREACCDDIVVAYSSDRDTYLRALVSFHELPANLPAPALALANRKYFLLNRVKRMLTHENQTLNIMERTILIGSIIALSAFAFLPSTGQEKKSKKASALKTEQTVTADENSADVKPSIALTAVAWADEPTLAEVPVVAEDAKSVVEPLPVSPVIPVKEAVRAVAAVPDTIPATGTNAMKFTRVSISSNDDNGKITSETSAVAENGDAYKLNIADGEVTFFSVNGTSISLSDLGQYENVIQAIKNRTKKNKTKTKASCHAEGYSHHTESHANCCTEENTNTNVNGASGTRIMASGGSGRSANVNTRTSSNTSTNTIKNIVEELVTKNIIESKDYVNFSLKENEFIVNGVKQNASITSHFANKFSIKPGDMINVVINGGSTTSSIRRN